MPDTANESVWDVRERAQMHELLIVRSRHACRKVLYQGRYAYVAGVCLHKGDTEMVVYLEGSSDPVRPCDITIPDLLPGETRRPRTPILEPIESTTHD